MKPNTWDTIFLRHLRRGEDHGSAAYAADQWEKRQHVRRGDWPSPHLQGTDRMSETEKLRALLREAESAWCEAAILVAHADPERQRLAKARLFAWRDKVAEALS